MTAIERMVGHGRKANCDLLRLMTRRNGPTPSALFATFSTTSTSADTGARAAMAPDAAKGDRDGLRATGAAGAWAG